MSCSLKKDQFLEEEKFDDTIFDSAVCHFSLEVFLWELFANLFVPFTYCFNPIQHNYFNPSSMLSLVFFTHIPAAALILMLISYPLTLQDDVNISIPLFFYMTHKLMVALKYATLSPSEYQKISSVLSYEKGSKYQQQLQIYPGIANEKTIRFELVSAAAKVGTHEGQIFFILPHPHSANSKITAPSDYYAWSSFLKTIGCDILGLPVTYDGRVKIDVHYLCELFITDASKAW